MSEEIQEQSEVVEVQTESATVENESSTQLNDVEVETETVEESIPLSRLNKEVYKKHEAKREVKSLKEQNAELRSKLNLQTVETTKRPTLEDEDIDFNQDLLDDKMWEWRQNQRDAKKAQVKTQQTQQETNDSTMAAFNEKAEKYAELNPSYDIAIANNEGVEFHKDINAAILQSDDGAELHHHLLKNPEELEKMSNMNSYQKMKHLGKIEDSFSKPKTIKKSKASEPIETVKGVASVATKDYPNSGGATFT